MKLTHAMVGRVKFCAKIVAVAVVSLALMSAIAAISRSIESQRQAYERDRLTREWDKDFAAYRATSDPVLRDAIRLKVLAESKACNGAWISFPDTPVPEPDKIVAACPSGGEE